MPPGGSGGGMSDVRKRKTKTYTDFKNKYSQGRDGEVGLERGWEPQSKETECRQNKTGEDDRPLADSTPMSCKRITCAASEERRQAAFCRGSE